MALFDRLRGSVSGMEPGIRSLEAAAHSPELIKQAMREAARELVGPVRQMLRANLAASGLHNRTGTLAQLVGLSVVELHLDDKAGALSIRMPGGRGKHPSGGGNVYTVAASLNYGAVYAPQGDVQIAEGQGFTSRLNMLTKSKVGVSSVRTERGSLLGQKAKRSVKKSFLSGRKLTKRSLGAIQKASGLDLSKGLQAAGVRVVAPHPFYRLTPAQVQVLNKLFAAAINRRLAAGSKAA